MERETPSGPLVSVVIPVYNRAKTVRRAIESVLTQDYSNIEVVVVDDGSTDGSQAIVNGLGDPRVVLIQHPVNRGVSAARNTGIFASTGEFLAFQDSDDEWLSGKLSAQIRALQSADPQCVLVYCTKVVYGRDSARQFGRRRVACVPSPEQRDLAGDLRLSLIKGTSISPQTMLMRSQSVRAIGGFDTLIYGAEEWDFCQRLAQQGTFAFVDEPLVNTYIQDDSISKFNPRVDRSLLRTYNKMKRRGVNAASIADPIARLGLRLARAGRPHQGRLLTRFAVRAQPLNPQVLLRAAVVEWLGLSNRLLTRVRDTRTPCLVAPRVKDTAK